LGSAGAGPCGDQTKGIDKQGEDESNVAAVPTSWFLLLSAILFVVGVAGVLVRRNALIMLMCVEMMMNAVNLTFIALSRHLDSLTGQIFVLMVMAVAAVEVAVGLAILIELNRLRETTDVDDVASLKG
jgi:NADH-quinone oxidoreductase subunit K